MEKTLQKKEREWNESLKEKEKKWNESIQQKDHDLNVIRKHWKQLSNELNRVLAQTQRFHQITDHDLIRETTQSRFNIRYFTDQEFGGVRVNTKNTGSRLKSTLKSLMISL